MYAVIETGGKQYRVSQGDVIRVEKLEAETGASVNFDKVLMVAGDKGEPVLGIPYIKGGKVKATIKGQGRHRKVEIFKMRRRKNYRKHQGHRQYYTEIQIDEISTG